MKIVYIGNFSQVRSTEEYIALGLEACGATVQRVQEDAADAEGMLRWLPAEPYVLLFSKMQLKGMTFRDQCKDSSDVVNFLRDVRSDRMCVSLVTWVFDLMRPEFSVPRWRWANAVAKVCDKFVCTDSGLNVPNVAVVRQGYPGPLAGVGRFRPEYQCRIGFLGELYGPRRHWWSMLRTRFDSRRYTDVFCDDLLDCCRSAEVMVGPPYPSFDGYWSNRIYLVAGYGGLFAGPTVEGMLSDGWVANENYIELPLDVHESAEVLKHWLSPTMAARRAEVRLKGTVHARTLTYKHRAAQLLPLLERRVRS